MSAYQAARADGCGDGVTKTLFAYRIKQWLKRISDAIFVR